MRLTFFKYLDRILLVKKNGVNTMYKILRMIRFIIKYRTLAFVETYFEDITAQSSFFLAEKSPHS